MFLISPTGSLTLPKTEDYMVVKQYQFFGLIKRIFASQVQNSDNSNFFYWITCKILGNKLGKYYFRE